MKIKIASLVIVFAMITSLGGTAFARASDPPTPVGETTTSTAAPSAINETVADNGLKVDLLKLMADAKAGKVAPRKRQQFPRNQRNNLSTGAKIGIVAAIAGLIFVLIVIHQVNNDE